MTRCRILAAIFAIFGLVAGSAHAAAGAACGGELAFDGRYCRLAVEGWTAFLDMRLLEEQPKLSTDALQHLRRKLQDIAAAVPARRGAELRRVPLWLELEASTDGRLQYHPGGSTWPRDHGFPEAKVGAVDIGNVGRFVRDGQSQPSALLHELAHAFHNQVLGFRNEMVLRAYRHAVDSGLYREVKRNNGGVGPAYALTNEKEYFAELSEAYFGENDFFPFVRDELKAYDPIGFEAIRAAWEDYPAQLEHAVEACRWTGPVSLCCPHEKGWRSVASREATRIVVRNATTQNISMIWLDIEGQRKSYAEIPAGAMHVQETFGSHFWLLVDSVGSCVAELLAERGGLAIRLDDSGK